MSWLDDLLIGIRKVRDASVEYPPRFVLQVLGAGATVSDDAVNERTVLTVTAANLGAAAPQTVTRSAAVVGSSPLAAPLDHKHDVSTGAPIDIGTANSAGSGSTLALANHVHRLTAAVVQSALATVASVTNFNNQRIGLVADPTGAQDAATKNYIDAFAGAVAATASALSRRGSNGEGTYAYLAVGTNPGASGILRVPGNGASAITAKNTANADASLLSLDGVNVVNIGDGVPVGARIRAPYLELDGGISSTFTIDAFAASYTPDLATSMHKGMGPITGNITVNAPTSGRDGMLWTLDILQDGVGSRTVTFNAVFKFGGTDATPSTTASTRTIWTFRTNGSAHYCIAVTKGVTA